MNVTWRMLGLALLWTTSTVVRSQQRFTLANDIMSDRRRRRYYREESMSMKDGSMDETESLVSLIEESEGRQTLRVDLNREKGTLRIRAPPGMNSLQVFEEFDQDRSGMIELKEFLVILHALGYEITEDETLSYFRECDADGSNAIDLTELAGLVDESTAKVAKDGSLGLAGADVTKCVSAVHQIREAFLEKGDKPESELPAHLEEWCISLGASSTSTDAATRRAALAWKSGCEMGRRQLEASIARGKAFSPASFCSGVSTTLGEHVADEEKHAHLYVFETSKTDTAPYSPPVATSNCRLQYLKEPRPCCMAHGKKGCHDKSIESCVCAVDAHCCENGWDLRCTELVEKIRIKNGNEVLRCGRCPVPVNSKAALASALDSKCG